MTRPVDTSELGEQFYCAREPRLLLQKLAMNLQRAAAPKAGGRNR